MQRFSGIAIRVACNLGILVAAGALTTLATVATACGASASAEPDPATAASPGATEPSTAAMPAADPAPCADAANHAAKLMASAPPGSLLERRCVEDKWSTDLRKCLLVAKSEQELTPCDAKFVGTQLQSLKRDLDAQATTSGRDPTAIPPPPVPAAPTAPPANTMPGATPPR